MKNILLSILGIALLFASSAAGQNKVVVVPLIGGNSEDAWIRVYDKDNKFIGYSHSFLPTKNYDQAAYSTDVEKRYIVTTKNYTTEMSVGAPFPTIYFTHQQYRFHLVSDCSDSPRFAFQGPMTGNGMLIAHLLVSPGQIETYYSKSSDSPAVVTAGQTFYRNLITCEAVTEPAGDIYLYPFYRNDMAVTGIEDSKNYSFPFILKYNLPSSP